MLLAHSFFMNPFVSIIKFAVFIYTFVLCFTGLLIDFTVSSSMPFILYIYPSIQLIHPSIFPTIQPLAQPFILYIYPGIHAISIN